MFMHYSEIATKSVLTKHRKPYWPKNFNQHGKSANMYSGKCIKATKNCIKCEKIRKEKLMFCISRWFEFGTVTPFM